MKHVVAILTLPRTSVSRYNVRHTATPEQQSRTRHGGCRALQQNRIRAEAAAGLKPQTTRTRTVSSLMCIGLLRAAVVRVVRWSFAGRVYFVRTLRICFLIL